MRFPFLKGPKFDKVAKLGLNMAQHGPTWPNMAQDRANIGPIWAQHRPKMAQHGPNTAQDRAYMCPMNLQRPHMEHIVVILELRS